MKKSLKIFLLIISFIISTNIVKAERCNTTNGMGERIMPAAFQEDVIIRPIFRLESADPNDQNSYLEGYCRNTGMGSGDVNKGFDCRPLEPTNSYNKGVIAIMQAAHDKVKGGGGRSDFIAANTALRVFEILQGGNHSTINPGSANNPTNGHYGKLGIYELACFARKIANEDPSRANGTILACLPGYDHPTSYESDIRRYLDIAFGGSADTTAIDVQGPFYESTGDFSKRVTYTVNGNVTIGEVKVDATGANATWSVSGNSIIIDFVANDLLVLMVLELEQHIQLVITQEALLKHSMLMVNLLEL